MIRVLKWTAIMSTFFVAALATYVARTWNRVWDVPMPAIHARNDAESIRRSGHLVYGPAHCVDCHAQSTSALEEYARTGVRPSLDGGMPFTVSPFGTIVPEISRRRR